MSIPFTVLGHGCPDLWNSRLGRHGGGSPSPRKFLGLISLLTECPTAFSTPQQVCRVFRLVHTHLPDGGHQRGQVALSGDQGCLCLCSGLRLLPWTRFSARDIFFQLACSLLLLPFSAQKHLWVPGDVPPRSYPVRGSRPDRWGMEFSLAFWPGVQQAWEGL